jgi:hypothetical protein
VSATSQPTAVLVWQGKVLPIVTDVFATVGSLDSALQNRDLAGVSKAGDDFAGELVRFTRIKPTPPQVGHTSRTFATALKDIATGTRALARSLRSSTNSNAQRASNQITAGLREFQSAIDQIRKSSGPSGEPTVVPPANAGPTPTPIIRGLP